MRPSKFQTYMEVAEAVKKRSHDSETQVGAVLINNKSGAIIATGANGFVRGANDSILPTTRPDKYLYMIHAETNLICNCARHAISTDNCTLVCTMSPCVNCMRQLFQAGVTTVIAKELYKDFNDILAMKDLTVTVSSTPEGFWLLEYRQISGDKQNTIDWI